MNECPRCLNTFERDATFCPQCGYDFTDNTNPERTLVRASMAFFFVLMILMIVAVIGATGLRIL